MSRSNINTDYSITAIVLLSSILQLLAAPTQAGPAEAKQPGLSRPDIQQSSLAATATKSTSEPRSHAEYIVRNQETKATPLKPGPDDLAPNSNSSTPSDETQKSLPGDDKARIAPMPAAPDGEPATADLTTPSQPPGINDEPAATPAPLLPATNSVTRASTAMGATAGRYEVGPEDVLKIGVYERPDLTGEFRVRLDGTVSVPLLGAVQVKGMDEGEIERLIAEKIERSTNKVSTVNVEIKDRRPFFVNGAVEKAGPYPFVPGMTVTHAISIAGGLFRLSRTDASLAIEAARENARILEISENLKRAFATQARLSTELANGEVIAVPARLLEIVSSPEAQTLIGSEQLALQANVIALRNLTAGFKHAMDFSREQIGALEHQRENIFEQISLNEEQSKDVNTLLDKGLTNRMRVYEMKTLVARLYGESRAIDSLIAQARQNLVTAEREMNAATDKRRSELFAELAKVDAQIAIYQHALGESRKIVDDIMGFSSGSEKARKSLVHYSILRNTPAGTKIVVVDETSPVQPGDVLQVTIER